MVKVSSCSPSNHLPCSRETCVMWYIANNYFLYEDHEHSEVLRSSIEKLAMGVALVWENGLQEEATSDCCFSGSKKMSPDHQGLNTAIMMEVPGVSSPRQSSSLNTRLESNERQTVGPRGLLQNQFMATVTASHIPGSPEEASVPTPDPYGPVP